MTCFWTANGETMVAETIRNGWEDYDQWALGDAVYDILHSKFPRLPRQRVDDLIKEGKVRISEKYGEKASLIIKDPLCPVSKLPRIFVPDDEENPQIDFAIDTRHIDHYRLFGQ